MVVSYAGLRRYVARYGVAAATRLLPRAQPGEALRRDVQDGLAHWLVGKRYSEMTPAGWQQLVVAAVAPKPGGGEEVA